MQGLNADPALSKPGFKVLHVPDLDCWSTVPAFKLALEEILAWSVKNPRHLPVMILLECKDQPQPPLPTQPETLARERLLELEREILSVIPPAWILRPMRSAEREPLRDAVKNHGWPTVDSLRGKFLFGLDNTDAIRARYLEGNPSLETRFIFASAPDRNTRLQLGSSATTRCAYQEQIRQLVTAGFLVRTRADESKADPKMNRGLQQRRAMAQHRPFRRP